MNISTHDLTKRSTNITITIDIIVLFQLTTSRRGRQVRTLSRERLLLFQLTTSRRGRRSTEQGYLRRLNFNSRPHEEVDIKALSRLYYRDVFQLTTSRRGRQRYQRNIRQRRYFNSRPHEEVDGNFYAKSFPFQITFCAYCI